MTDRARQVRDATVADAGACAGIYAPYVNDTAISFELVPPTPTEMAERIRTALDRHAWVVLEQDARVVGYAYGGSFKAREAYRWSCEVSVYVEQGQTGRGAGRSLYEALFHRLADRGLRTAVAGMTVPNEASVALHRSLGFEPVGTYWRIGYKLGRWRDVTWMQRPIGDGPDPPTELR